MFHSLKANALHVQGIIAGLLESAYWLLRGVHSILGNGGGEPLALLW